MTITSNEKQIHPELYKSCFLMVRSLVKTICNSNDVEVAKEIFHDTLTIFYEKQRKNTLHLTAKPSTFIYAIAENKCKEYVRRQTKYKTQELVDIETTNEDYDKEKEDRIKLLEHCIDKLPETKKKILISYYYLKQNMSEIAQSINSTNSQSIKTQKYKAIMDLKHCFSKNKKL